MTSPRRQWLARALIGAIGCFACGCAGGSDELVVRVTSEESLGRVDTLTMDVFLEESSAPIARRRLDDIDASLPRSFVIKAGPRTQRQRIRARVVAHRAGVPLAAGDVVATMPAGSREVIVALSSGCLDVSCPRLQSCDGGGCDGRCTSDAACGELLGCAGSASCSGSVEAPGSCSGQGADGDGDGYRDRRCSLESPSEAGVLDCDDDVAAASPEGEPTCGAARDHDCDGLLDELQGCSSSCGPDARPTIESVRAFDLGFEPRAVAGPRLSEGSARAFVAGPEAVVSFALDDGGDARELGRVEADDSRGLSLRGPLLAVAARGGLKLVEVAPDGGLTALGPALGVPPGEPAALVSVSLAGDTAWVSGDGVGLAAVNVRDPSVPLFVGAAGARMAPTLAPLRDGVLAATTDGSRPLLFYPADDGVAPGEAQTVGDALGLEAPVTAVAPRRGDASDAITLATPNGIVAATYDGTGFARVGSYARDAPTAGLYTDVGVLVAASAPGVVDAYSRGADPGAPVEPPARRDLETRSAVAGFAATTRSGGDGAVAAVIADTRLWLVSFACP